VGARMRNGDPVISPDGTFALVSLTVPEARGDQRSQLVRIDLSTGDQVVLADEPEHEFYAPLISPDNTRAVIVADRKSTPEQAPAPTLHLLDLATGERAPLAPGWDRWGQP